MPRGKNRENESKGDKMRIIGKSIAALFLTMMVWCGNVYATPNVVVSFSPAIQTVERNGHVLVSILVSSNEDIQLDGMDANVSYNAAVFEPPVIHSNIGGWMVSLENTVSAGRTVLQKGGNAAGELFPVSAHVPKILGVMEFKVRSDASLVTTSLIFQNGFINITAQGYSESLVSTYNKALVGITADTAGPLTVASHASGTYNAAISVVVSGDPSDRAGDLKEIRYTLTDRPGVTPNAFSAVYGQPLFVPANTTRYVMFYGVDQYGNAGPLVQRVYAVDTSLPALSAYSVSPSVCGKGQRITVQFTVSKPLDGGIPVSVSLGGTAMTVSDNIWPEYVYYYDVRTTDAEGTKNIEIVLKDTLGNTVVNNGRAVYVDFTPPYYTDPHISAQAGSVYHILFNASEVLDLTRTVVSVSGNMATFVSANGLTYRYQYARSGTEGSRLVRVDGYDLGGNYGQNTEGWNVVTVHGHDIFNNAGETRVSVNIIYP